MPKQLIPIANRPILEYGLNDLEELGITEIGIIVGSWESRITDAIGNGSRFGARITYIRQDQPRGLAHAIRIARPFLGDDDFILYLGDNVFQDGVADAAVQFRGRRPPAQIVVQKVEDPRAYGVAEVNADGTVRLLIEKPREPRSNLAVAGVYFFTAAIHEAVDAIRPSARNELEITDAIQWLIDNGAQVTAHEYAGFWMDVGQVDDALECNRKLLSGLRPRIRGDVDPESELHGLVTIDPGARIVRSRVTGPAIVGENTLIADSRIGPNVSIGPGCVIRGAILADTIVLADASVSAACELRGSFIGRSVVIEPAPANEIHHRLVVGDDARIEVAS